MYKIRTNEEIGEYLGKLINEKFTSTRQFGIECLRLQNTNRETDPNEVQKMSNRLSKIKKGENAIQLGDLPVFTHLLDVTAEEILSAGTDFLPREDRYTNYKFALSNDEEVWEDYINRGDRIILNTDEYGKTVIDYAVEFRNYGLLKYMTEKGYIWFVGKDGRKSFSRGFGAGTSIKREEMCMKNRLETELAEEDRLRMEMIVMALEHKDYFMLNELCAREVPSFYLSGFSCSDNFEDHDRYCPEMIKAIAGSGEETIKYFCEEFDVEVYGGNIQKFMFPYMNELLNELIKKGSRYTEYVIGKCIEHNRRTFEGIVRMYREGTEIYKEKLKCDEDQAGTGMLQLMKDGLSFDGKHKIIKEWVIGIRLQEVHTNIICSDVKTSDPKISGLKDKLNGLYDKIVNLELL